jgi:hypothetical protein
MSKRDRSDPYEKVIDPKGITPEYVRCMTLRLQESGENDPNQAVTMRLHEMTVQQGFAADRPSCIN